MEVFGNFSPGIYLGDPIASLEDIVGVVQVNLDRPGEVGGE